MVPCKFGQVPKGCVLSYQQPVVQGPDITPITSHTTHPKLLLPQLKNNYCTVLKEQELESFLSIHLPAEQSKKYESVTRKQSESSDWVRLRKSRLTASQQFKQVHQRRKDFEKLVENFKKSKLYQSAAMKYGLEKEQETAGDYVKETGNNVYGCGFVINPSAPFLGCSPDRKVYDPKKEMPGLLEIKLR